MPEALYCVIYASRVNPAHLKDIDATLRDILVTATRKNSKRDVTGLLIAHRGWFVQALEGPAAVVQERFRVIIGDPRHRDAVILAEGATQARLFGAWSMCAKTLSPTDATVLEMLDQKTTFNPADVPERTVIRLLTTVAEVHRRALTEQHQQLLIPILG